jgi:hypothetical protein
MTFTNINLQLNRIAPRLPLEVYSINLPILTESEGEIHELTAMIYSSLLLSPLGHKVADATANTEKQIIMMRL